jgi:GTPase
MSLTGELKGISSADKAVLEKIQHKKLRGPEIADYEVSKKISGLVHDLRRSIAILVARDGKIVHLVIGTKQRVYLPSLGRFRLDDFRLRRLRLIVFVPESALDFERVVAGGHGQRKAEVPRIAADFITDLEKLRLDLVCVTAVSEDGLPSVSTIAYLDVLEHSDAGRKTEVRFLHETNPADPTIDFNDFITELEKRHRAGQQRQSRETTVNSAILVGVYTGNDADAAYSMNELQELCRTAGVTVAEVFVQKRSRIDPRTVLGKGKIEELVLLALDLGADLLLFDCELTPSQLRAISRITELKIIDRSMLILDIFALRAKSAEGRLQVELAQLSYSLPRLTEKDSGLSRLTGGIGGRGPGETKLEISRRRVRDRIAFLEDKINNISRQRGLRRDRRKERGVPVVAIVGYTNAGKSTLLNSITKGEVLAENRLFATLDPSSRRMRFPNEKEVVFVDTVGFIRNLPEELVGAFRATLEEVGEADLLLHVVDASGNDIRRHITVVQETLDALGYGARESILILNKIDLLGPLEKASLVNSLQGVPVSAVTREGLKELVEIITDRLNESFSGSDPGGFLDYSSGVLDV